MTLLSLVLLLVIIGVVLWAVQQIPMDDAIRRVLRVVVIVVVVLWLATSLLSGHHAEWNPRLW